MKNHSKAILAAGAIILAALATLGAKSESQFPSNKYVVEVGQSYQINTYPSPIVGKVVAVVNNGWFVVAQNDGKEIAVNVSNAYSVERAK